MEAEQRMNIDVHCHVIPQDCLDMHATAADGREFGIRFEEQAGGGRTLITDGRSIGDPKQLWNVERRLRDMDASGIDLQAISIPPFLYFYAIEAVTAAGFARRLNDGLTAVARRYPERFITLATVPLQDTDLAIAELDRAVEQLGMRGVEICSNVAGENLDAPRLLPFFRRVEQLDVPIFIHPHYVAAQDRLREYYLVNLIGNPVDTTIAAASLVFGGIMAKFQRLNVYLAHGGGTMPYICGRWQHGWEVRTEPKRLLDHGPSVDVRRFYFDTITHSPEALAYLVNTFGSDKVLLGTDYPFDMGDMTAVETVKALGLPAGQEQMLLGGNAARLFKLSGKS